MLLKKLAMIALVFGLMACGAAQKRVLHVYAASSLTESFQSIETMFERDHPDIDVQLTLAGSNQLRTQIEQGAAADVFAAAAMPDVQTLVANGAVQPHTVQVFAQNRLALIVPRSNPAKISTIQDLANPQVRLIVADDNVPVGRYTLHMLEQLNATYGADFAQRVQTRIVSRELNVKQVATKIQLGEGDAGIVYRSDITPELAAAVQEIALPDAANPYAQYPIAVLKGSNEPDLAQTFVQFVQSDAAQTILRNHGFLAP